MTLDDTSSRRRFLTTLGLGGLTLPQLQVVLEAQDTRLLDLPEDASLAAPFGNLGPGATYYANTPERNQGETFLKQGVVTFRRSGFAASAGRFEWSDGLETVPADPSLAWLKRSRIAERLVGPFGYTHVTRSFDGVRLTYDRARWNATGVRGWVFASPGSGNSMPARCSGTTCVVMLACRRIECSRTRTDSICSSWLPT